MHQQVSRRSQACRAIFLAAWPRFRRPLPFKNRKRDAPLLAARKEIF